MFRLTFVTTTLCLSYNNGVKIWSCTDCVEARKWKKKHSIDIELEKVKNSQHLKINK